MIWCGRTWHVRMLEEFAYLAIVLEHSVVVSSAGPWRLICRRALRSQRSARTSPHNFVFLEGLKAALTADPLWQDEWFASPPLRGLRAFARIYAGWGVGRKNTARRLWRCQVAGLLRWMLGQRGWECYVPRLGVHDGASGAVWAASGRAARNASKSWHQSLRSKTCQSFPTFGRLRHVL